MGTRSSLILFLAVSCALTLNGMVFGQASDKYPEFNNVELYFGDRSTRPGGLWVYSAASQERKIIGYAEWNEFNRVYRVFDLDGKNRGLLRATTGTVRNTTEPSGTPFFTQFLFYDNKDRYKGIFVRNPGGRPESPVNRYGELGGTLRFYRLGSVSPEQPSTDSGEPGGR